MFQMMMLLLEEESLRALPVVLVKKARLLVDD